MLSLRDPEEWDLNPQSFTNLSIAWMLRESSIVMLETFSTVHEARISFLTVPHVDIE